jgi:hypothetical protein
MLIESLNVWGARKGAVLEEYLRSEVDRIGVFFFQEADKNFPEICRRVLGPNFILHEAYKKVDDNDIFPQMICIKKGFKVLKTETVLEKVENVGLAINCQVQENNRITNLCNLHGISRPGTKLDSEKRIEQSTKTIQHFNKKNMRTIVGGDFNLMRNTKSIGVFNEAGYRNLIEEFGIRTTRNKFAWEKFPETPQMDSNFMFVGPGIKVVNFEVIDNLVSDHLPMILEVE